MTPIRHLSETENISSSYRLLSSSATHRWKKKKREGEGKIAPKHCGRSHMALSGAVRHSTKAGRQNKKRQFLILYLSTRYIPILAEESCGALRQGGICQNDRASEGVKKNRAWEQTSCLSSCQRTPRHLNASLSCLWIGTRTVINIYNSLSFPTSQPPFAVFFSFFFFSNPPARYLPFVFFALLITFVSIIFSF